MVTKLWEVLQVLSSSILCTHACMSVWSRHMQTENNESNVSRICLVPTRIVCPDTEKWPISARFGGGGGAWQSPALCWQPNRVEEESIIRITYTNIKIQNTHLHSIRHVKLCACLLAQKNERKHLLTDIFYLKQSTSSWPLSCQSCKHTDWARQGWTQPRQKGRNRSHGIPHPIFTYP